MNPETDAELDAEMRVAEDAARRIRAALGLDDDLGVFADDGEDRVPRPFVHLSPDVARRVAEALERRDPRAGES